MKRSYLTWLKRWKRTALIVMSFVLAVLLLALTLAFFGTPSAVASRSSSKAPTNLSSTAVLTIGIAGPLSGPAAFLGWWEVNAAQLAISQTNEAGGIYIGGITYTLILVPADDGCNSTNGVTAANTLLSNGVVAVIGHACSSASLVAEPIYNGAGVAMISPSATAMDMTRQGYTTTFRVTPNDGAESIKLAQYFMGRNLKRTAILLRNPPYLYSPQLGGLYQDIYTGLGGTVVSSQTLTTTTDITPALTVIQGENVDVIFVADLTGDLAGEVSRIAYTLGLTPTIAVPTVIDDYISTWAGAPAAENDYGGLKGRRTTDMPGYLGFAAAYTAAYTEDPGFFSPQAYDAANLIIDAIQRAGTANTLAIRNAIASTTNFAGVVGTYQGFDANGDVIPQWAHVEVVADGRWTPAMLDAEFGSSTGGTFDLEDTWGQTTTIAIPPNATTSTLSITYTAIVTTTNAGIPTLTMIGEQAIRLEANLAVSLPMTLTVRYDDTDIAKVDESTLTLFEWNGSQWVAVGSDFFSRKTQDTAVSSCGSYLRDQSNNVLEVGICHFGDYVLLGRSKSMIYLPLVLKASP